MSRTSILPQTPQAAPDQIPVGLESRRGRGSHPIYDHPELAPQGYKESLDKGYNNEKPDPITTPLKSCGTRAVRADCHSGNHSFAKVLHCGREWCPVCGKKDSAVHKQRVARLLPKAQTMGTMGYLVIEWQDAHRDQLQSVDQLRTVRRSIIRHLKGKGYSRGIARWHFYGDNNIGHYNPHLNILIPTAYMAMPELEALKRGLARLLGVDMVIVNYQYASKVGKMMHLLKYVTRATFTNHEWNPRLAAELYRFNVTASWGNWKDQPVMWELHGQDEYAKLANLESHKCPICGKPIEWCRGESVNLETGEITHEHYDPAIKRHRKTRLHLVPVQQLKNEGFTEYASGWLYWDYKITGEYQLNLDDQDMFDRYCELEQLREVRTKERLAIIDQNLLVWDALDEYCQGIDHVN